MKRFFLPVIGLLCLAAVVVFALDSSFEGPSDASASASKPFLSETLTRELLSDPYLVDQKYRSMKGPYSQQEFQLGEGDEPELLWITGYRAVMVDQDGESPMPQEFMCHSNLDLDPRQHNELFGSRNPISGRLFTLSQGQFEIGLPEGFGLPVLSTEALELTTQVLNLNHDDIEVSVRHRVQVDFVRDEDLKGPMKPLLPLAVYGLASLEEAPLTFGRAEESEASVP